MKLTLFCLILTAFQPVIWLRRLALIGICVTGAFYLYSAIYIGVVCGPKGGTDRASYLAGTVGKTCHDRTGYIQIHNVMFGVFNVLSDIYLLVIPIPAIIQLRLPFRKKIGILMIFLTGFG